MEAMEKKEATIFVSLVQEKQIKLRGHIMKKMHQDPDMLEEYDFSKGVRGKYAKKYAEGTNIVIIDPDVAKYFPDHDAVNEALRALAAIIEKHEEKVARSDEKKDS